MPPDLLFGGWAGAIVVQGGFFRFWVGGTGCARGGLVCGEGVLGGSCGVTNGIFGAERVNVVVLSWWFVFDRENKKLAAAVSVLKKKNIRCRTIFLWRFEGDFCEAMACRVASRLLFVSV